MWFFLTLRHLVRILVHVVVVLLPNQPSLVCRLLFANNILAKLR